VGLTDSGYIHFANGATEGPFESLTTELNGIIFREDHSAPTKALAIVAAAVSAVPAAAEFLGVQVWNGAVGGVHSIAAGRVGRGTLLLGASAFSILSLTSVANVAPAEADSEEVSELESLFARTPYRAGVRQTVWNLNADSKGRVFDTASGARINANDPWQMGHLPGYEFRQLVDFARMLGIGRAQFIDYLNNPIYYRPELSQMNAAGAAEAVFGENYYLSDFLEGTVPLNPVNPLKPPKF
jgi:hypothetical protein